MSSLGSTHISLHYRVIICSVAGTGLEVYLASISNTITTTDVAVLMPGQAPKGNLRALDFNAIHGHVHGKDEFDGRFLTIVKTRKSQLRPIQDILPKMKHCIRSVSPYR
jgi:hypothetical protein